MHQLLTLGTVDLRAPNGASVRPILAQPKRLALLVYLSVAKPRGYHRRDTLLGIFWPDLDEEHARGALSRAVYYLRRSLGDGVIDSRGDDEIGIAEDRLVSDVAEFETALDTGKFESGLGFYRGNLLEGFFITDAPEFDHWLEVERKRLRERAAQAAFTLANQEDAAGNAALALRWARRGVTLLPYDEDAFRRLAGFLNHAGDHSAVVLAYGEFARRLKDDLGVEPSAQTRAFIDGICSHQEDAGRHASAERLARPSAHAAMVSAANDSKEAQREGAAVASRWRRWVAVAVLVLGTAGAWEVRQHAWGHPSQPKGLAVMSFTNLSPDSANAYFASGITDDIALQLSRVAALRVITPTAVQRFLQAHKDLRDLADSLGLDGMLSGSVQWASGRVRVAARLENPRTGELLWGQEYDRSVQDIFAIQSDIAHQITAALKARLLPGENDRIGQAPTDNVEAYGYTLRALDLIQGTPSSASLSLATDLLRKAVNLDPEYGRAYAELADVFYWHANRKDHDSDLLDSTRAYISKALAARLDREDSAVAYRVMAISYADQHRYRLSLEFNLKATRVNPEYFWASVGVAELSFQRGDFELSLPYAMKAVALKPQVEVSNWLVAKAYLALDDTAHGRAWANKTAELFPDDPEARVSSIEVDLAERQYSTVAAEVDDIITRHARERQTSEPDEGRVEVLQYALENAVDLGDYGKAQDYYRQLTAAIAAIRGESEPDWQFSHPDFTCKSINTNWGYVLQHTGHEREAQKIYRDSWNWDREKLQQGSEDPCNSYDIAAIAAARSSNVEEAYSELQAAINAGWGFHRYAIQDPLLDSLHAQPRFLHLMSQVASRVDQMRNRVEKKNDQDQ